MQRTDPAPSDAHRGGFVAAVCAAAGAVLAAAVTAIAVPVAASAITGSAPAPKLTSVTTTRSRLPSSGGHVRLRAKTAHTRRCALSVRPALPRLPARKHCSAKKVTWRVRLPRNDSALAVDYRFTLQAVGAHHVTTTRHQTVRVAAAAGPPSITSFTASPAALEFVGGDVQVDAHLARTLTCAIVVSPNVEGAPPPSSCTGRQKSSTLTLPPNQASTPVSYTIELDVTGSHRRTASVTRSVSVAAHPPPCPGQTSAAPPTTSAYFNDPTTHTAADQTSVVDAEINLICDAQLPVAGVPTTISLADFVYQLDQVTQALLWAHQYMHADVHVVLDGTNEFVTAPDGTVSNNPAYDNLVAGLPAGSVLLCGPNAGTPPPPPGDKQDEPTSSPAGTGCAGDNIMHAKLLTVSSVDAAHDPAVFSNSQNLSENAVTAALNNGLQIVGDPGLYAQQERFFSAISQDQQQPDEGAALSSYPAPTNGVMTSSTFFPQNSPAAFPPDDNRYQPTNDAASDSVAHLLNQVRCTNPGPYAGTHTATSAHTTVRLAMFAYVKRPAVTAALDGLQAAGCDLSVIYAAMSANTLSDLQAHGVPTTRLDDNQYPYADGSGTGRVFVHDKYLLISGRLAIAGHDQQNETVVVTGSSNLTQNSLHRNDEANVTYQQIATGTGSTPVYSAYASNWDHLAALAAAIPPAAARAAGSPASR